jgi:hypothetical protein
MTDLEPLWQIEEQLTALLDSIDTCPDDLKGELEARIGEYLEKGVDKVDRIAHVFSTFDAIATSAKTEIGRLRARAQAAEKAAKRLEGYVLHVLRKRNGQPLKGHNVTFTARRSESVVITDPELVPAAWKRQTLTIDIHQRSHQARHQSRSGYSGRHDPIRGVSGEEISRAGSPRVRISDCRRRIRS